MSIDYGKLDRVYAFADFLDLLSNPAAMQQTVAEYKEQAEVLKALIEKKTAVDNVDSYVSSMSRAIEEQEAALAQRVADFDAEKRAAVESYQATAKKTQELQSKAEALTREAEAFRQQAAVELQQIKEERALLASERNSLASVSAQLVQERDALAAKAEQLKALIG
jgi:chromosome segregation ATPase